MTDAQERPHFCHVRKCRVVVPCAELMCARHWIMLPLDLRRAIYRTYQPGQEITKRVSVDWINAARRALDYVRALETGAVLI